MEETIILKIQKLLALSKSSNINEAENAMLKAQELMIKYKISQKEIENFSSDNICIKDFCTEQIFRGKNWKTNLARVIANNFCCYFYTSSYKYNMHEIHFYGKEEDVNICNIMFEYAIKCINSNSNRLLRQLKKDKRRKHFDGVKNDYALGFIYGLNEKFQSQIAKNEEWGLVLQKDKRVIDSYNEFSRNFGTISLSANFNRHTNAYYKGVEDGKEFDISDKIATENEVKYINI